jgi:anti-sigma factor RsiW
MHDDCLKCFEKISEYLDGELDSCACDDIEAHIQSCPKCQNCFDSLKQAVDLCRHAPRDEVPEAARHRLRVLLKAHMAQNENQQGKQGD